MLHEGGEIYQAACGVAEKETIGNSARRKVKDPNCWKQNQRPRYEASEIMARLLVRC